MFNHKQGRERRKEPRFYIKLQASIQPDCSGDRRLCRATLDNISLHGMSSYTDEHLTTGQEILVKYTHAQSGREVMLSGRIRWLVQEKNKFKAGIELYQKNVCSLTLEQASTLPSLPPTAPNSSWQYRNNLLPFPGWQDCYQSELYWGYFFKTFQDHIQRNLILISSNLNMSITHLESILHSITKNSSSTPNKNQLNHLPGMMEKANFQLMQLVKLFQMLQEENIANARAIQESKPEIICISDQLKKRVNSFQEKIECMLKHQDIKIFLHQKSTSLRKCTLWRINYGIDFLIMHAYHFIFFENANYIDINILDQDEHTYIEIKHDGSSIFSEENKELILNHNQTIKDDINMKDRLNIVWFYLILDYLSELNASILIKSDPGNNIIVVRI